MCLYSSRGFSCLLQDLNAQNVPGYNVEFPVDLLDMTRQISMASTRVSFITNLPFSTHRTWRMMVNLILVSNEQHVANIQDRQWNEALSGKKKLHEKNKCIFKHMFLQQHVINSIQLNKRKHANVPIHWECLLYFKLFASHLHVSNHITSLEVL